MSQASMAKLIGINRRNLCDMKAKKCEPRPSRCLTIAIILWIACDELIDPRIEIPETFRTNHNNQVLSCERRGTVPGVEEAADARQGIHEGPARKGRNARRLHLLKRLYALVFDEYAVSKKFLYKIFNHAYIYPVFSNTRCIFMLFRRIRPMLSLFLQDLLSFCKGP